MLLDIYFIGFNFLMENRKNTENCHLDGIMVGCKDTSIENTIKIKEAVVVVI